MFAVAPATRLTTNHNQERQPAISPDGRTLAFVGRYEGGSEIYTMPLDGGRPERRTFGTSGVQLCGFTAQGRLVYSSRHRSPLRDPQLFVFDPKTGTSRAIPLSEASHGAFAADGKILFFTRFQHRQHVKRYVGGRAEQLWRFGVGESKEAVPLTKDWAGTSHRAMVSTDRVYFISDRDGTRNLWSMTHEGKDLEQHSKHVGFDVLEASLSKGRIAYRVGASLRLLDLASGADPRDRDHATLRLRTVARALGRVTDQQDQFGRSLARREQTRARRTWAGFCCAGEGRRGTDRHLEPQARRALPQRDVPRS